MDKLKGRAVANDKTEPIGVCDHCKGEITDTWYTRRGPRRYCCVDCRNTANSRAGAPTRSAKNRARVAAGVWQNPHKLNPPTGEEQARRARLGRLREVAAGTWRNPALADVARVKLSRPRKHTGDLHRAIEKLKRGLSTADLSPEEQEAHRAYRRRLWAARVATMTQEERDRRRAQYRAVWHRRKGGT